MAVAFNYESSHITASIKTIDGNVFLYLKLPVHVEFG